MLYSRNLLKAAAVTELAVPADAAAAASDNSSKMDQASVERSPAAAAGPYTAMQIATVLHCALTVLK
jgi:hypothetical protein